MRHLTRAEGRVVADKGVSVGGDKVASVLWEMERGWLGSQLSAYNDPGWFGYGSSKWQKRLPSSYECSVMKLREFRSEGSEKLCLSMGNDSVVLVYRILLFSPHQEPQRVKSLTSTKSSAVPWFKALRVWGSGLATGFGCQLHKFTLVEMASLLFQQTSQWNAHTFTEDLCGWALPTSRCPESERPHRKCPWDVFFFLPQEATTWLNYLLDQAA